MASAPHEDYRRERRPTRLMPSPQSRSIFDRARIIDPQRRHQEVIEARRQFVQKLSNTYGHQKTHSEINFMDVVHEQGALSLGLMLSYFFMLWYGCCHYTHSFTFGVDYIKIFSCDDVKANDSSNISLEVKCFSPQRNCCNFGRYNYIEVADFYNAYYGAFMDVIEEKVLVRDPDKCKEYLSKMNNVSYMSLLYSRALFVELQSDCYGKSWPLWIKLSGGFGRVLAGFSIGLVGDMHGRKPAFITAASIQTLGYVLELIPSTWSVFVGEFLAGFGPIAVCILYILILEKCNSRILHWMGLLGFLIHPFTNLVSFVLRYSIKSWKLVHLANTCMLLVGPFGMWYMVESPRWLMMVGNRPAAWEAVQQFGLVVPNPKDLRKPVAPRPTLMAVLRYFQPSVFRERIIILMLFYFLCAVSLYVNRTTTVDGFEIGMIKFFAILTSFQVVIYMFSYLIAIKLGRRRALFYLHCVVSFLDLVVFMAHKHFDKKILYPLMLYGHMASSHAVLFIVIFYTVELFPTAYRATALGISISTLGAGEAVQHYLNYAYEPREDNISHMPAFIGSLTCALAITFLPVTNNGGLPDRPTEALYLRIVVSGHTPVGVTVVAQRPKKTNPKNTKTKNTNTKNTNPKNINPKNTNPKSTNPKNTNPKNTNPKNTDPKNTNPKIIDPKNTNPKNTNTKTTDQNNTNQKNTDPTNTDPRNTDPKMTNPKNTAPKATDQKNTNANNAEPKNTNPKIPDPENNTLKNTNPKIPDQQNTIPKDTNPKNTGPKNTNPKNTNPTNTNPKNPNPKNTDPKDSNPKPSDPKNTNPKITDPKNTTPKNINPKNTSLKSTNPKTNDPKNTNPKNINTKNTIPRNTDPKNTNPKNTDAKTTNPKNSDPKNTNPKNTNPKNTDPKNTNPRNTNAKTTDPKNTNPKITEPKTTNPKISDPKNTNPKNTNPKNTDTKNTNPKNTNPKNTNPKNSNPKTTDPRTTNPKITDVKSTNPKNTNPKDSDPKNTNPKNTDPKTTNPKKH